MATAAGPREDYLELRGNRVHYFRAGSGPPLLFLHGTGSAGAWLPVHAKLAERFEVIAPDHPGFGLSDRPDWLEGIDDLVIHYLDLLDALGLDRVHVVGTSFGGWVAAELAVSHAQRLRRLVLVDAAGLHVPGAPLPDVFWMSPEENVRIVVHDQALAEQMLAAPADEAALQLRIKGQTTLALLAWNPYLHNPKLARRLYRVTVPTLVVWGEHDRLIPPAHGEAYAAGIPNARLAVVPNCGHLPHYEQLEEFVRLVRDFLAE